MANVILNPSFESVVTPWLASGGTIERSLVDAAPGAGVACGLVTSTSTANLNVFNDPEPQYTASEGQTWSIGAYYRWYAGTQRNLRLDLIFLDAGGVAVQSNLGSSTSVGTGSWVQLKNENRTAPANTAFVRLRTVGLSATAGDAYLIDAIQAEQEATLPAYNEGGTLGGTIWTRGVSVSIGG